MPPAGRPAKAGTLEATDQTMVMGFTDDIVVRVEGNANRSRIDVRSASRYGVGRSRPERHARAPLPDRVVSARSETTAPAGRRPARAALDAHRRAGSSG